MSHLQFEDLRRLRYYQRALVYGGGLLISALVLLVLVAEIRAIVTRQIESLRQSFDIVHAEQERELSERINSFHITHTAADSLWKSSKEPVEVSVAALRENNLRLNPSSEYPMAVSGAAKQMLDEELLRSFLGLALAVSRVVSSEVKVNSIEHPIYLYSLRGDLAATPDFAGAESTHSKLIPPSVVRGILSTKTGAHFGVQDCGSLQVAHWVMAKESQMTDGPVAYIVAPFCDRTGPMAVMVAGYTPPKLSVVADEAFAIVSERGYSVVASEGYILSGLHLGYLQSKARHGRAEFLSLEGVEFVEILGDTDWLLIASQTWPEFAAIIFRPAGIRILIACTLLILIWGALIYFKMHLFRPLITRSEQVVESERLSRILIETAPVGLGLLRSHDGEPLLLSPTMKQIQERVRGDSLDFTSELIRHYDEGIRHQDGVVVTELTYGTLDGSTTNLSVSMAPARFQGQDVLVVAFTDVTHQKQLERQLVKAKEAADRANYAKSAFLAAMSHEIRTPLSAIIGNLELLSHLPLDAQRERLKTIRRSSDSLMAIVSDVLDFSKIEAGQLRLEYVEFDAYEVAASALEIFAPMARAKGLVLRGELGVTTKLLMCGDPSRLRQIINNLLSNALKFTEHGQVTLRLGVDFSANSLNLEVQDSGIGMSESQVLQAFDAFNQADESVYRRYGGTGLGLTLCMRLTKAMNGKLSVRSALGQGSRFKLVLPLGEGAENPDSTVFANEVVLVVADHADDRSYLLDVMGAWGLRVQVFDHPLRVDEGLLAGADALVLWRASMEGWRAEDENRLVEQGGAVIDCISDGPREPVASGRVVTTTMFGLRGLASALNHVLHGLALPLRVQNRMMLAQDLRVLVVEDNPVIRQVLDEQLRLLGCQIMVCDGGESALDCLRHERFDVLLTDLSMPGMDGYALSREAKLRWPEMPIVAATAAATVEEHDACSAVGISRVLVKPLSLDVLARTLWEVTGQPTSKDVFHQSSLGNSGSMPKALQDTFVEFCTASFSAIRHALAAADYQRLMGELHSLKGALGVYRLTSAARQVADLERKLSANEDDAAMLVEPLLQRLTKVLPKT